MKHLRNTIFVLLIALTACGLPSSSPATPLAPNPTAPPQQTESTETAAPTGMAEIIFMNGDILTMDPANPNAQAIAIKGNTILAIGTNEDIMAYHEEDTALIDLAGLTMMPGFVDAHTHLLNDADSFRMDFDSIQQLALENGITTIGNMFTTQQFLNEVRDYNDQGKLRIRTSLYLNYNTNCGDVIGTWWKNVPPTREAGEMLRIGGVKIFADGGTCKRPALSYETSPGSGLGDLFLNGDQIAGVVREAQGIGHQVAIHALGDRAIEAALNGIESALAGEPNTYRHRIEHNAILRPDLLSRYGEVGVVATVFATFPSCTPFGDPSPEPYNQWEWAWNTLIDSNPGLHVAWHGDDPFIRPLNPLLELYGFVTRKQAEDDRVTVCDPPYWIEDDTLTVEQALPMMTRESAYALFRDEELGTITPGKFADLIILSASPLTANPETLLETRVLMTMVGGKVEFCVAGNDSLCPSAALDTSLTATPEAVSDNPITASSELPNAPASNVFDGDLATIWNSGAGPEQWIQIDLGTPSTVSAIRLVISQFPAGETIHQIWVGADAGNLALLHEFKGFTTDPDNLDFKPSAPLSNIRFIRIVTSQSPSWVAWREIQIIIPPDS